MARLRLPVVSGVDRFHSQDRGNRQAPQALVSDVSHHGLERSVHLPHRVRKALSPLDDLPHQ